MTLRDYLTIMRRRWPIILLCALVAGGVTWFITPPTTDQVEKAPSYTATATLLAESRSPDEQVALDRIALYVKTGEIPTRAARVLGFEGDPAILASQVVVTPDSAAEALTIAASAADGEQAAATANAFADETVTFFKKKRAGTGRAKPPGWNRRLLNSRNVSG